MLKCMPYVADNRIWELLVKSFFCSSRFGWLIDGTAGYPMQEVIPAGGNKIGIVGVHVVRDKINQEFNAWCYKNTS